jgi:tetratricopeptide (TPR) repeat protein
MSLTIEQALIKSVIAHKEGNLQEAERLYCAILRAQPLNPDANHNLGVIAVSVNQLDAALPLFKTAVEANPKIEQFWLSYIDALIKTNQLKDAKQKIKKAKKKGFDAKKLQALLSQPKGSPGTKLPSKQQLNSLLEHFQDERFSDAEKLAISLTHEFPKHEFGWKILGAVLKQTGRVSESLVASQKSVQLAPKDAEAHSNLCITLKELGRLDEAEASVRKAIALKPDLAEAHNNLGVLLKERGRLNEAEACYKQLIVLKPDFAEAHNNLGALLKERGRLDEAEVSYRKAIVLKPDYAIAHSNWGLLLKQRGRLDEAAARLTQAIVLKPDYVDAARSLVKLPVGQLNSDALNLSEKIFEKAFNILDASLEDQIAYLFFRGNLLKHRGFIEQSFNVFCKANKLKLEVIQDRMKVNTKKNIDSLIRIKKWVPSIPDLTRDRLTKIFILGPSRSGKSTLEHILSENLHVKAMFELIQHNELIKNNGCGKKSSEFLFENTFAQSEAKLFEQGYKLLTSTNPESLFYSDHLIDMVPNVFFIFVNRDYRDISSEIFTREYKNANLYSYDPNELSKYLDVYNKICEMLVLKVPDRCLTVSFEDIIQAPEAMVDRISSLVGSSLRVNHLKRNVTNFESESLFRDQYAALSNESKH